MTPRYLYPHRKRLEILSAIFATGFAVHLLSLAPGHAPLAWAGVENGHATQFAGAVAVAALVHALGVHINGRWRWSPALRLVGMAAHACLFAWLAARGVGQSASYTYGCVAGLMAYGAKSAALDTWRAWKGNPAWMAN